MRWFAILLIVLVGTACQHPRTNVKAGSTAPTKEHEVVFGLSDFEGALYFFETSKATMDAAPKWKAGAEFPPLSPRKAIAAGLKEAGRLRPDVSRWNLESVSLRECGNEWWVYEVKVWRGDVFYAGLPFYLSVPVLMDGTAVQGVKNLR